MPGGKIKHAWADPNREGKSSGRRGERFCAKCGNTVQHARILKLLNLCEFCLKELEQKRDGVNSCRSCGKVAPEEIGRYKGYCRDCICPACGKPDSASVRRAGFCSKCLAGFGDFCRSCGKEAAVQVKKNKGVCDECVKKRGDGRQETGDRSQKVKTRNKTIDPVGAVTRGIKIRQKIEAKRGKKAPTTLQTQAPVVKRKAIQQPGDDRNQSKAPSRRSKVENERGPRLGAKAGVRKQKVKSKSKSEFK
jgi:hypothetical protein